MKIAFIHACLEPGRDGVGDHTIGLASECERQGVHACALAINDSFVSKVWFGNRLDVPCLRLPQTMPWRERQRAAEEFLDQHSPDWVSLQFVCYAYSSRGLVFGLPRLLRPMFKRRHANIMFHELWIGRDPGDSVKDRSFGWLQRLLIQRLFRTIGFETAHTSNQYYVSQLRSAGIAAGILPLFGAVGFASKPETVWLNEEMKLAGWLPTPGSRDQFLLFGFFGSIHPVWSPEPLFSYLAEAGARLGKQVGIISVGRQGPGVALWDRLVKDYSHRFKFLRLGARSAECLEGFFLEIDYGLATTPYALIGKSGTTASMLEHGLPVIVNRDDIPFKGEQTELGESQRLLIRMRPDLPGVLVSGVPHGTPSPRLPKVAALFLRDLQIAGNLKVTTPG